MRLSGEREANGKKQDGRTSTRKLDGSFVVCEIQRANYSPCFWRPINHRNFQLLVRLATVELFPAARPSADFSIHLLQLRLHSGLHDSTEFFLAGASIQFRNSISRAFVHATLRVSPRQNLLLLKSENEIGWADRYFERLEANLFFSCFSNYSSDEIILIAVVS